MAQPASFEQRFRDALALHRQGQVGPAMKVYESLLLEQPAHAELLHLLGVASLQVGQTQRGVDLIARAVSLKPTHAEAFNNLGNGYRSLGKSTDALSAFERAIALKPEMAEAHLNRANVLLDARQAEQALASAERASALQPNNVAIHVARGNALLALRKWAEAQSAFSVAVRLDPRAPGALLGEGRALLNLDRAAEALERLDRAIIQVPEQGEPYTYRAYALLELKRLNEALQTADRAVELSGVAARRCRADVLHQMGRKAEALADYEAVLGAGHDIGFSRGYYLSDKLEFCDWGGLEAATKTWVDTINAGGALSDAFPALAMFDDAAFQRLCAERVASVQPVLRSVGALKGHPASDPIKIGYFSSDFHNHPVSHLLAGALAAHDRARFEIYAFAFRRSDDAWKRKIESAVDHFIDLDGVSLEQTVAIAREAQLDVAVDLNGYTKAARTPIFAARVAPIQVAYLGYLGTMGADYIDYLIADDVIIPAHLRAHYGEKIVYLPWYQCNDADANAPGDAPLRRECHLPEDAFVFCSFNNSYKITPHMFDMWMRVLARASNSVLWLYAANDAAARNLSAAACERGIAPERIVFAERVSREAHLARQRCADLVLDTYPYNGGATSSNALRAGLPVLTRTGEAFAARMGASLLAALGLNELIAQSDEAFESKAAELATSPSSYAAVKAKLAGVEHQPLFSAVAFARYLESGFAEAVSRHRNGEGPANIEILRS